jgi:hypothetical protein
MWNWSTRLVDLTLGDLAIVFYVIVGVLLLSKAGNAIIEYIIKYIDRPKPPRSPRSLPPPASPTAQKWFLVILVSVLALVLVLRATYAQNITTVPVKPITNQHRIFPPAEYDHYYEGDLTIKIVDTLQELHDICQLEGTKLLACSTRNHSSCIIVMVRDEIMRQRNWTTGMLLRHEMGHCNGWPGDHPGERAISWPTTHWAPEAQRVKIPLPTERPTGITIGAKGDKQ